ncbi:MAG: M20/M25/M40 family metallo-hydrolase, partial [Verrucomicrobiota bacterium]
MELSPELQELFAYLRFPSVSTDSRRAGDVKACAEWLEKKLRGMDFATTLHETPGHPVLVAKSEVKEDRPTVLIYGHYDVQPAEPLDLWESPAFEPEIREGVIYARGSTDNKGQNLAHILGVEATLKEKGELPVNVIFLLEGEEEIGSPSLEPFLEEQKSQLQCDVVAVSDTGMIGPGIPTM